MMGSGLPPRPLLSGCPSRCMQSLLPRRNAYPKQRHFHHQSVQTNLQQRAAVTAAPHAGQQQPQPTISHVYPLPRTKVYEHTRPQPRAPVRHRLLPGRAAVEFKVNDDQSVLDDMYTKLFGRGPQGAELLGPELRWQAVTHISFDHGRQPYNNKLAFLGRRILFFYANLYILQQPPLHAITSDQSPEITSESVDSAGETPVPTVYSEDADTYLAPTPFEHADYKNIDAATYDAVGRWTDEMELARIARGAGLYQVMRWKPMNPGNLVQSGMDTIAVECLHAIIGAIALSNGGVEAKRFVNRLLEQRVQSLR